MYCFNIFVGLSLVIDKIDNNEDKVHVVVLENGKSSSARWHNVHYTKRGNYIMKWRQRFYLDDFIKVG